MNQINVLHIDDSMMILDAVENYFQQFEDIGIIGRAQDGESALALARKVKPDIILLDINLPDINGIDKDRHKVRINSRHDGPSQN